jgi:hypothetical protein
VSLINSVWSVRSSVVPVASFRNRPPYRFQIKWWGTSLRRLCPLLPIMDLYNLLLFCISVSSVFLFISTKSTCLFAGWT